MKRSHDFAPSSGDDHKAYEYVQLIEYPSFTALPKDDLTPLEFRIDQTNAFIDLSKSFVQLEMQLLKKDGSILKTEVDAEGTVTKEYNVAPVNNIACALFDNVELFVNDQLITASSDSSYPWWTYVYQLLFLKKSYKEHQLRADSYWYEDTAGQFDNCKLKGDLINQGHKERHAVFDNSEKVKVVVPIILNRQIDRLLPPQAEVRLRFNRSPTNLCLMGDNTTEYKIKIWNARLFAQRIKMFDTDFRFYERLLHTKGFKYPTTAVTVKAHTVSKGDQNVDWTPFVGQLPSRIFFYQITHEAYNADVTKNPFNLQSFLINRINVSKNGVTLPLANGFGDIQDDNYHQLYKLSADAINTDEFMIPKADFNFGYLIICVDLTKDGSEAGIGTLRITIDYKTGLAGAVTLFCMAEFPQHINIGGRSNQITFSDAA